MKNGPPRWRGRTSRRYTWINLPPWNPALAAVPRGGRIFGTTQRRPGNLSLSVAGHPAITGVPPWRLMQSIYKVTSSADIRMFSTRVSWRSFVTKLMQLLQGAQAAPGVCRLECMLDPRPPLRRPARRPGRHVRQRPTAILHTSSGELPGLGQATVSRWISGQAAETPARSSSARGLTAATLPCAVRI